MTGQRPGWASGEACRDGLLERSRKASGADSVRRVSEACRTLADGGNAVTIAAVGKFCVAAWGGPKGQSISNNRGLAGLVHMAAQVQADTAGRPGLRPSGSWEDRLLSGVPDPHVRSQVQTLLVERRGLLNEVNSLRQGFKRLKALEILTPEMAAADVETLEQLAEALEGRQAAGGMLAFTDEERGAVRTFLDPARMARMEGWAADEASGELRARSGRPVATRGFLAALRKVACLDMDGARAVDRDTRHGGRPG